MPNKQLGFSPIRAWRQQKFRTKGWGESGTLLSWSVVANGPVGMNGRSPYIVGLIELNDRSRVVAQVVDVSPEDLTFGLKVKGVLRRLFDVEEDQIIVYGVKFTP